MNNHELREAERKEVIALQATMNGENYMDIMDKIDEVHQKYRILRRENTIIMDWSFPAGEWATLSSKAKATILDMVAEAERYERLREDLQSWLEDAP